MSTRRMMMASAQHVVDGIIQDSWEEIIENINKGYAEKYYSVGDVKELDLIGYENPIHMEIVGFHSRMKEIGNAYVMTLCAKEVFRQNLITHRLPISIVYGATPIGATERSEICQNRWINKSSFYEFLDRYALYRNPESRIKYHWQTLEPQAYYIRPDTDWGSNVALTIGTNGMSPASSSASNIHPLMFSLGCEYPKNITLPFEEDSITDNWEQIVEKCKQGIAKDHYKCGDTKTFVCEGIPIQMEYIGSGLDTASDGGATPITTWISKKVITLSYPNLKDNINVGQTAYCNWESSGIRLTCQTLENSFPSIIKDNIVFVDKTAGGINPASSSSSTTSLTVRDKVWIPSVSEVKTDGLYGERFPTDESRIKTGICSEWALRDRNGSGGEHIGYVRGTGYIRQGTTTSEDDFASQLWGVVIGFCL